MTDVQVSRRGNGFAYVPGRLLVSGDAAAERADQLLGGVGRSLRERQPLVEDENVPWRRLDVGEEVYEGFADAPDVVDVLDVVDELRSEGFRAQPDHVFFAHGCTAPTWARPCPCDPTAGGPWASRPGANPLRANPLRANPLRANPLRANHPFDNTARPADGPELVNAQSLARMAGAGGGPRILVLDSGIAGTGPAAAKANAVGAAGGWGPAPLLQSAGQRISGDAESPDTVPENAADGFLDPVAGHGTFIAGIIEQLAPGCTVTVLQVLDPLGLVCESDLVTALHTRGTGYDIVSMSFGGPVMERADAIKGAVARLRRLGAVVVASAGNDATCVPHVPASLPGVIAVGALGTCGPAEFTNYGDWVDACAPGVDLVSAFFDRFDGRNPAVNGLDLDRYTGWARWSGTSFAAPVVVAALAREVMTHGVSAVEAVWRVIEAPHLLRLPCLGTVVNL